MPFENDINILRKIPEISPLYYIIGFTCIMALLIFSSITKTEENSWSSNFSYAPKNTVIEIKTQTGTVYEWCDLYWWEPTPSEYPSGKLFIQMVDNKPVHGITHIEGSEWRKYDGNSEDYDNYDCHKN